MLGLVRDFVNSFLGVMAIETRFLRHSMAQIRVVTFTRVLLKGIFEKISPSLGGTQYFKGNGKDADPYVFARLIPPSPILHSDVIPS